MIATSAADLLMVWERGQPVPLAARAYVLAEMLDIAPETLDRCLSVTAIRC